MKIIMHDNYDNEPRSEKLVAEGITNPNYAKIMCDALCEHPNRPDADYYFVKEDDYVLWRGMADLVGDIDEEPAIEPAKD